MGEIVDLILGLGVYIIPLWAVISAVRNSRQKEKEEQQKIEKTDIQTDNESQKIQSRRNNKSTNKATNENNHAKEKTSTWQMIKDEFKKELAKDSDAAQFFGLDNDEEKVETEAVQSETRNEENQVNRRNARPNQTRLSRRNDGKQQNKQSQAKDQAVSQNFRTANQRQKLSDRSQDIASSVSRIPTQSIAAEDMTKQAIETSADIIDNYSLDLQTDEEKGITARVTDQSKRARLRRAVIAKEVLDKPLALRKNRSYR